MNGRPLNLLEQNGKQHSTLTTNNIPPKMSSTTRKGGKKGSSSKRSAAMDVDEGRAMAEMPLGKQLAHTGG